MPEEKELRVLVAIPAYNCENTVACVVRECRSYVPDVLVVDDGSVDETATVARMAGARVLRHERNQGKGMAIRSAANEAMQGGYSGLLTIDGDGQHDGTAVPRFNAAHRRSPQTLWVGWRREGLKDASVMRRVGNRFANRALEVLAGVRLPDTQCGLRLYPTELLRRLSLRGSRYEVESEILIKAQAQGCQIRSLPIRVRFADGRPTSHYRPWADTARICNLICRHSLQHLLAAPGSLAAGLTFTHVPLAAAAFGASGLGLAVTPALAFHLAMGTSLLRPRGQTWVDTEIDFPPTPGSSEIALTFDDGPDPMATPRILDLLERANVPATFFLIGRNVDRSPGLVAEIAARGHALGNHTYSHLHRFSLVGYDVLAREVDRAQESIQRASGQVPILLRPPVGHKNVSLGRVLRERRMRCVTWTASCHDTLFRHPVRLADRLSRKAHPGAILLLHDRVCGDLRMLDTLPRLIDQLSSRGFQFTTLPGAR